MEVREAGNLAALSFPLFLSLSFLLPSPLLLPPEERNERTARRRNRSRPGPWPFRWGRPLSYLLPFSSFFLFPLPPPSFFQAAET